MTPMENQLRKSRQYLVKIAFGGTIIARLVLPQADGNAAET